MDLTVAWAGIIAFAVAFYVVADGFDLGIGILFPGFRVGSERDAAMNAIAPVWDGNETWLVLGGGGLFAAFPLAYAIVLPAVYAPLIAMLLGLVFRGVAFEFRWRDPKHRRAWDLGFCLGSFLAAFAQGVVLGALLQGISIEGRAYAGGWWEWLSPFSILTGVSVVLAYALLGAGWLIAKTEGRTRDDARRLGSIVLPLTLVAIGLVSLSTPFLEGQYYQRWFVWPGLAVTLPMPILVAAVAWFGWRSLRRDNDAHPFLWTLALYALCFVGLGISIWPDVIPGRLSIWDAAAPESSQLFMLAGTAVLVPIILAYTAWSYWVFRGKVAEEGYH
ncbi:cytochrome d ubiquinol oxidase subunit II [Sphingomonas jejuensis]|uniref:Cytochrome d ubiquinol oxidase subunit II n=1 Tax=Sphingomonas jejuensis TaxID=904715 RepID=A0ABX0XHW2_9SPHN|nr:cytochrome d ubiquinol oxidase subunit II [Sphingomonas jejuensis]NJC32923.1 cytochrome d ubiquinol oxidase subunit II [Sphingomonas jejuensis]